MKEIDYNKIVKVEIVHEMDRKSFDFSTTLVCDIKDLERCINNFAKRNIKILKISLFEREEN